MTVNEVLQELESLGSEQTRNVLRRHGARDPFFGVKIEDLKKLRKKFQIDHQLALDLYATGNSDAMYLASLCVDPGKMTRRDLERWVKAAYWYLLSECAVASVAAESRFAAQLALKWIDSKQERIAAAGWSTLSNFVSIQPDADLDAELLKNQLERVSTSIHEQPNRVRYTMNAFVIAVGCFSPDLTRKAMAAAKAIGQVSVEMGETECKVPVAVEYLLKVQQRGSLGKKRKSARC